LLYGKQSLCLLQTGVTIAIKSSVSFMPHHIKAINIYFPGQFSEIIWAAWHWWDWSTHYIQGLRVIPDIWEEFAPGVELCLFLFYQFAVWMQQGLSFSFDSNSWCTLPNFPTVCGV